MSTHVAATAAMASLVGSLADNKAALGRRYAEWGVSAPTLESAVAAAAMAQDEMGHARSTYPVLKALGVEAGDEGLQGRGNRLALLDDELPDWTAFIAANLLVDGILTTFVAATVDSTLEPMAQRARKILQEEGSHRVHGEAWATPAVPVGRRAARPPRHPPARDVGARVPLGWPGRGPGRAGGAARGPGPPRARRAARAGACMGGWAARRRGPADHAPGARGLVVLGPAAPPLGAMSPAPRCPFCDADATERVGQWGGQIITAQWVCRACNSHFEAIRDDFDDDGPYAARRTASSERK